MNIVWSALKVWTVIMDHVYGKELEQEYLLNGVFVDYDHYGQLQRGVKMLVYAENFKRDESWLGNLVGDEFVKVYEFVIRS